MFPKNNSIPSFENVQMSSADLSKGKISILKQEHVEEAVELFTKDFCDKEPLCKYLNISYDKFKPYAQEVVEKAMLDGLSVVGLDAQGRVMGIVLAEDIVNPVETKEYPFLRPIHVLLKTMSKPFVEKKYRKNCIAHIWVTAVAEETQGVGLSTILNNACVALILQHGFSYVFAEFTSAVNERHMNRFPDYMKCELKFKDFLLDGKRPFENLEGVASAYICSAAPHVRLSDIELCLIK